jgi:hypothetical protein
MIVGSFGEVRKAVHKFSGMVAAIKIVEKEMASLEDMEKFEHEF